MTYVRRTPLPTGGYSSRWYAPGGIVVTLDAILASELLEKSIADIAIDAELLTTETRDVDAGAELLLSLQRNGEIAAELLSLLLTVIADGNVGIELLTLVTRNEEIAAELLSLLLVVTTDRNLGAELLTTMRLDGAITVESQRIVVADVDTADETLRGLTVATISNTELLTAVVRDAGSAAELLSMLLSVVTDRNLGVELQTALYSDSHLVGESSTRLVADRAASSEISGLAVKDTVFGSEALTRALADRNISAELITGISVVVDRALAVELLRVLNIDAGVGVELLGQQVVIYIGVHVVNETVSAPSVGNESVLGS